MLRLLKLIRRFGQIQLLAHVFRTTGAGGSGREALLGQKSTMRWVDGLSKWSYPLVINIAIENGHL